MKAKEYEEELKKRETDTPDYKPNDEDKAAKTFFAERKRQLVESRKQKGIEKIWRAADKAYEPHTLTDSKGKKVLASNDELGWRSQQVVLNQKSAWREDSVSPNPYVKIQVALGIIVDRNPGAIFKPGKKKYQNNTLLIENLYKRSWDVAKSKTTLLKPFVFNMAKYGIGCGRTYPLKITRTVGDMVSVDPETTKAKYEDVEHTYFDDVFRENLSPWQCWFDDGGIIGNPWSFNDNMWYKDYSWDTFTEQFGHLPNAKYVKPSNKVLNRTEYESESGAIDTEAVSKLQLRIWFYENVQRDTFYAETDDGVVLINECIPRKPKHKKLSLFYAPWTLRDDKNIEGIGVYEAMRNDYRVLLKIRNMTIDQLVLSIYKEWFYEGTDTQEKDGAMTVEPGRGRQVVNPQNIRWNEIPGPGKEAWEGIKFFEEKIDEVTGVTRGLSGEVLGKTAFETAQAREAALKRLKTPLENLTDALEIEAYITCGLIDDLYSVPKIKLLAEDRFVEPFELELQQLEALKGGLPEPQYEEQYREMPLAIQQETQDGKYVKSEEENFIELLPDDLDWEGTIKIKAMSIIADSELLERTTISELAGILTPMLAMPPELALKPATEIVKGYNRDPKEWLPDVWINPQPQIPTPGLPGTEVQGAPGPAKPIFVEPGSQAPADISVAPLG